MRRFSASSRRSCCSLVCGPIAAAAVAAAPPAADQAVSGLDAAQVFAGAERLLAEQNTADAEVLLRALTQDPDRAVRNEARFRLARLLEATERRADAAVLLRRILDEEPEAVRVRLELARILVALGDETGARRQLRQAQDAGLPAELARLVDQYRIALRSRAPFGANIEVAVAPDSNINRATAQRTLDGGFFPIELDEDARSRSGIGLAVNGQAFARVPLDARLSLLPRASGAGRLYRDSQFDDVSIDGRLGLERADSTAGRLTLSAGHERRWFGGRPLTESWLASLDWLRPVSGRAQFTVSISAADQRFPRSAAQSGRLYQASIGYERALSTASGISVSVSGARQDAADQGYANWSGGSSLIGYAEIGRTTFVTSVSLRRLVADGPFFLFPDARREWSIRSSIGATFRQLTIAGLAPVLRVTAERNLSTVGLFDFRRIAAEVGISRAF